MLKKLLFGRAKDAPPVTEPAPIEAPPPAEEEAHAIVDNSKVLAMAARISKVGHWVWDNVSNRILDVGDELANIHETTVAQYFEKLSQYDELLKTIHPDDRARYDTSVGPCLQSGRGWDIAFRMYTQKNNFRHVREIAEPVRDGKGVVIQYIGTLQDITDIKAAEAELHTAHGRLETAAAAMSAIVAKASVSISAIRHGTAELSEGAMDLSRRTELQVAGLEEMAAAIRQLTVATKQSSESAQQANRVASEAHAAAENGSAVSSQSLAAMERIDASSRRIADIIGLIEEVAFQTNLLSLNAAIEAARAGNAGRGFAVVAAEVRALSQRTSDSSKEIRSLIRQSASDVRNGVETATKAGQALADILDLVRQSSVIVSEIAASAKEQSAAVHMIDDTMAQIENATQQNASLVEQSGVALNAVDKQMTELLAAVTTGADRAKAAPAPGSGRMAA